MELHETDTETASHESLPEAGPEEVGLQPTRRRTRRRSRRKPGEEVQKKQISDEEIGASGRSWYFVNTYSGHEDKVQEALEATIEQMDAGDRVFHVIVPTEDEIEISKGERFVVEKKLYPGYVLVQTITLEEGDPESDNLWHMIRNTSGVTGFVSAGSDAGGTPQPVALTQDEVNNILRAMRMEQPRVRVGFQVGESVRIASGPFEDLVGSVDEINTEKGKVRVLVSMLGRETPVELDFLQVEKL